MDFYHIPQKYKSDPFAPYRIFYSALSKSSMIIVIQKNLIQYFEYINQGFFWHIESDSIMLRSRAIFKSLYT